MICSRCGNSVARDSASCQCCGASARPGTGAQAFGFDAARWSRRERITGAATVVLLISLFLPWFSVSALGVTVSWSGMTAHGYLWLAFALCLGIVGFLVVEEGFLAMPFRLPVGREMLLLAATAVNLLLVLTGFFVYPGALLNGVGWAFGAFVALLAAIAACVPLALPVLRARAARG